MGIGNWELGIGNWDLILVIVDRLFANSRFSDCEHLHGAFILLLSPLAYCIREQGRSHSNKKRLFTKMRCFLPIRPVAIQMQLAKT
ncbi:MAG: hypothetical protein EAZ90_18645 [Oscillatoriales cyanobacterium]|nr:MAG: hypothetical protein EAZ90_18645 [Oscillatoriales cyanobacterium]